MAMKRTSKPKASTVTAESKAEAKPVAARKASKAPPKAKPAAPVAKPKGGAKGKAPASGKATSARRGKAAAGPAVPEGTTAGPAGAASAAADGQAEPVVTGETVVEFAEVPAQTNHHGQKVAEERAAQVAKDWAAEMVKRRSKPVTVASPDDAAVPRIPSAREGSAVTVGEGDGDAGDADAGAASLRQMQAESGASATAPSGLRLPDTFLVLALESAWDDRDEKYAPGHFGAAIVASLVLEAVQHRRVLLQRDRLVVQDGDAGDSAPVLAALREIGDVPLAQQMQFLGRPKRRADLIRPAKQALERRGLVENREWKHLGLFRRSTLTLQDPDAREKLQNRVRRALAGGGNPDVPTILVLGLMDAAGLLETLVPPAAVDYNRKRLNALLSGNDPLGYKVDAGIRRIQEAAVKAVLDQVRANR